MNRSNTRVFSAVQPTGRLHLGNYLGALRGFVSLQQTHDQTIYAIADLHALTVPQDPAQLRLGVLHAAAGFLACGVDAKRSVIVAQSTVSAHAQLGWLMMCLANIGRLNRMTQFKEKSGKNREEASAGLYVYPALMAADILAYNATHVPVGDDQKQHLELARDLAQKYNQLFPHAEQFPLPEPIMPPHAARVMSLRDGRSKMSKSDPSELSRIHLDDSADDIAAKIRKAKTDPLPLPQVGESLDERPEALNLLQIDAAVRHLSLEQVTQEHADKSFSVFKEHLTQVLQQHLTPITQQLLYYQQDTALLQSILHEGTAQAQAIAAPRVAQVHRAFGL